MPDQPTPPAFQVDDVVAVTADCPNDDERGREHVIALTGQGAKHIGYRVREGSKYHDRSCLRHVTPTAEHADGHHWARNARDADGSTGRITKVADGWITLDTEDEDGVCVQVWAAVLVAPPAGPAPVAPEPAEQDQPVIRVENTDGTLHATIVPSGLRVLYCSVGHPLDKWQDVIDACENATARAAADALHAVLAGVRGGEFNLHDGPWVYRGGELALPEPAEQDQPGALPAILGLAHNGRALVYADEANACAVADHNEAAGLRAEVERLTREVQQVQQQSDAHRRLALAEAGRADEADALARAALAAAPGAGHDLPKVEVRVGEGSYAVHADDGQYVTSVYREMPTERMQMVTASWLAVLAAREREAAQVQAPAGDDRGIDVNAALALVSSALPPPLSNGSSPALEAAMACLAAAARRAATPTTGEAGRG